MSISDTSGFDHLVVLMLENRSFDNLFGFLYESDSPKLFLGRGASRGFDSPAPPRSDERFRPGLSARAQEPGVWGRSSCHP